MMKIKRQVTVNGIPAAKIVMDGETRYFAPNTPQPIRSDGVPVVGQWADKFINPTWRDDVEVNTDTSTHIDVFAWIEAFEAVYSES